VLKSDDSVAVLDDIGHLGAEQAAAEDKPFSNLGMFAGADECLPDIQLMLIQEKKLDRRAGILPLPDQPRRQNAGIVEHQQVARLEKIRKIIKMLMPDGSGFPVEAEHPAGISGIDRVLGNQLFGQVEIKSLVFIFSKTLSITIDFRG
jgi:hypothetical protein